jgi:predicted nucleic acid-binding protein
MQYETEAGGWKDAARNKWIIFDTDAIVSILSFGQTYIFDEFKEAGAEFLYMHPVLLELMNTDSEKKKLLRAKLLADYGFLEHPLTVKELKHAAQIQESLPLKATPSPTDLYLGGKLAEHHNEDRLLLTANIKDFPAPLYTRKGYVLLQSESNVKLLTLLCVDKTQLMQR